MNLSTWRQSDEGFSGVVDTAYGRFNTLVGSMKAGVKEGAFDFAAGASYKYSEGKRKHNTAELENAFTRGGVELGEEEYLTFIYRRAQSRVEDPGAKGMPTPVREGTLYRISGLVLASAMASKEAIRPFWVALL